MGELSSLVMPPPPNVDPFRRNVQPVTIGLLPSRFLIPPAKCPKLSANVHAETVGLEASLSMPVELPMNVQDVTIGDDEMLRIALA